MVKVNETDRILSYLGFAKKAGKLVSGQGNCENAIKELKESMNSDNVDDLKSKVEKLKESAYKVSEKLYQQQSESPKEPPKGTSDSGTAVDVEYEVKD